MRKILVFSLLTVVFAGCCWAEDAAKEQSGAEIEKEIMQVEEERDEAMQMGDAATLERIYGDDLAFVNARGLN